VQSEDQANLYVSHLDGAPPRRLTDLHGYVHDPAFSPDGAKVAFLYVEGATRPASAVAAQDLPSGVIGEERIQVQRVAEITVPSDGDCKETSDAQSNLPLASRTKCLLSLFNFLTPPNLHVYEFDWSPDSKSLAYIAADPPGENNWWVAKLYTQSLYADVPLNSPLAQGAPGLAFETWDSKNLKPPPTAILAPSDAPGPLYGLQIAVPRWSPDGKSIAFVGGLMSDQGVTGGDVWIVPSTGGEPRNLTPGRQTSAQWLTWDGNGAIFVSDIRGGYSQLVRLHIPATPADSTFFDSPVVSIPATVGAGALEGSLSATADRSVFVFQLSSFSTPPEIFGAWGKVPETVHSADVARIGQLSHFNDGVEPAWGKSVSLAWKSDQFDVQGWLLLPAHYDPAKKYPLLVEVHGGPASAVLSGWDGGAGGFSATAFSALDYFVLMPNPRGSYGQGEGFTQANRRDFGYGDLRDILAGVDAVLAKYPVDPNRIGIAGWSYGGFMTMFAVTQTHRFRAAVAGAGISDWLSYYGENSIDQWMIPYFGASVYDDPQVYAKSSPITFIKHTHTPTLLLVGDRDGECPAPQSFEFWHALRDLHVHTQLVVYPYEGHGFADPANRRDVLQRAVDWLARTMPPGP
jgi:dipeptidyl aminopeptidase/acylaminoacyl peptidase